MKESNYQWPTLLKKYIRKEINDNELKALHEYINTDPEKMRQFRQWTDSEEFAKQLQYYHSINTDKLWEKLEAKRKLAPPIDTEPIPVKKKSGVSTRTIIAVLVASAAAASLIFFLRQPNAVLDPEIKNHTYVKSTSGQEYDLEDNNGSPSFASFASNLLYENNSLKVIASHDTHVNNDTELDVVTAAEKQMQVQFTDGSLVKLSAASALRFPLQFKANKREVKMTGEAFFDVTPNKDVPFEVNLPNGVQVKAIGTSFNITNYEAGRIVMTLLTGTVEMIYGNLLMTVHQGEQVEFTKEQKFRLIKHPDLQQATAWINYEFNFDNKDIKDVIQEIGRYYNYKVIFKGTIPPMPASGIFDIKTNNLINIISAIKKLYPVDINPDGKTLIVTQTRPH